MPRPAVTRAQRVATIRAAAEKASRLIGQAEACEREHGADDARTLAAWEQVEQQVGAPIHRNARPLAGKSKGG